jgi:hypothetical protein
MNPTDPRSPPHPLFPWRIGSITIIRVDQWFRCRVPQVQRLVHGRQRNNRLVSSQLTVFGPIVIACRFKCVQRGHALQRRCNGICPHVLARITSLFFG